MAGESTFPVEVLTPEGEVFRGDVVQVSTRTGVGEIGVLANHAPMLAALKPTELRLHLSGSEVKRFAQAHGMMQVFANRAQVLVEEAIPPDELDSGALKQELEDAERRLKEADEESAAAVRAEKDRDRIEKFLEIAQG
jgi:F-type H+-transporting ATPase subunit epsilon